MRKQEITKDSNGAENEEADAATARDWPVEGSSSPSLPAEGFDFSGRHLLASYSDCDPAALADVERIAAALHAAVEASGATLLKSVEHIFPAHGFTAVALLSQSHASIHTYPEHNSCFVDLFTCGTRCNVEAFDAGLRRHFRPQKVSLQIIHRYD